MQMKNLRGFILRRLYDVYRLRGGNAWLTTIADLDRSFGAYPGASAMVVRALRTEGLAESFDNDGLQARLTANGVEQIEEPSTAAAQSIEASQHVVISGGNVQVGHNNQQSITYSAFLEGLQQRIEAAEIPAPEKSKLVSALQTVLAHPLTQTILSAAAGLGTGVLAR